jgi:hypothetical protein
LAPLSRRRGLNRSIIKKSVPISTSGYWPSSNPKSNIPDAIAVRSQMPLAALPSGKMKPQPKAKVTAPTSAETIKDQPTERFPNLV